MGREIYEKNMESLRKRFPGLAEAVEQENYEKDENTVAHVLPALDGSTVLRIEKEGRKLYVNGPRKPGEPAKREIERWGKLARQSPVCIIGMGDMAFARQALDKTDDTVRLIIYEPSVAVFLTMLHETDIRDYFDKRPVGLIVEGLNSDEANGILRALITDGNYQSFRQWTNISYKSLFAEKILAFLKRVDHHTTELIAGRNTQARFAAVKAANIFKNICFLCDGMTSRQLCDVIPTDIPAILVSAGPSLNKNIHELKRAKNRAFIVAVDTAVKPMVKAGILPDLYAIVDGKKPASLLDFEEAKQIPLMPSVVSASEILEQHEGIKFFYSEGLTLANNLMAMNCVTFPSVECGGSVACSGFSLLYKMGFQTIILVGQDLALTGNKTHADGTFQEKMDTIDTSRYQKVEGNYEKEVPTRTDFKMYLDWFNHYIENCKDIHVINATEGGAKIQNTEILTLKEAIDRECGREIDIAACMAKLKPALDEEGRKKAVAYLNSVPDMFARLQKKFHRCGTYYKRLKKMCGMSNFNSNDYLALLKKIKKLTKQIERHELYPIITETLAVANILIVEQQFFEEKDVQEEGAEIARQGILFTRQAEQCIELLLPLAKETVGKLSYSAIDN